MGLAFSQQERGCMSSESRFRFRESSTTGIKEFVAAISRRLPATNRRRHRREPISISLWITPLDRDFHSDGESFWAMARDISASGLGFVNPEPIDHKYIRISVPDDEATVTARVCHCTSVGDRYPLYLIGVQFLDNEY
jgi:hypothetical protein